MPFSVMTLSLLMRLLPKSTFRNSSGLKFQCHSINHWFQKKVPSSSRNALYDEAGELGHKEGELLDPDPSPRLYYHPFLVSSIN